MLNQYEDPNTWAQLMAGAAMMERGGPSYDPVSIGQTMSHGIRAAAGMYDMALRGQMAQKQLQLESDRIGMYDKRYSEQHQLLQDRMGKEFEDRAAERKKDIEVAKIMASGRGKEKDPMMDQMLKAQEQGRLFQRMMLEETDPKKRAALEKAMPHVMNGVYSAQEARDWALNELGRQVQEPGWFDRLFGAGKSAAAAGQGAVSATGFKRTPVPELPNPLEIGGPTRFIAEALTNPVKENWRSAVSGVVDAATPKSWFGGNRFDTTDSSQQLGKSVSYGGKRYSLKNQRSDGKYIAVSDDGDQIIVGQNGSVLREK